MSFNGNRIRKWLRIIHRDLGFLMAGICLIYAVSGILLNHMNGKDPAFKNVYATVQFPKGLMNEELSMLWKEKENLPVLKKVFQYDDSHFKLMLMNIFQHQRFFSYTFEKDCHLCFWH